MSAPKLSKRALEMRAARLTLALEGEVQAKMDPVVAEAATRAGARISAG